MANETEKKTVLIIEDEGPLSQVLSDELTNAGFIVLRGHNGEEGLSMALQNHPDMILLDVIMPKMDGTEVMEKLRADNWGKSAKIILLTNLGEDSVMAKKVAQFHPVHYLVKTDLQLADIVEKVRGALKSGWQT